MPVAYLIQKFPELATAEGIVVRVFPSGGSAEARRLRAFGREAPSTCRGNWNRILERGCVFKSIKAHFFPEQHGWIRRQVRSPRFRSPRKAVSLIQDELVGDALRVLVRSESLILESQHTHESQVWWKSGLLHRGSSFVDHRQTNARHHEP